MSTALATRDRLGFHAQAALESPWFDTENDTSATASTSARVYRGTSAFEFVDDEWTGTSWRTRGPVFVVGDVDSDWSSPTAVAEDVLAPDEPVRKTELDEALWLVREFERLDDGWDEPTSLAPSSDVVEDALVVLQNWPMSDVVPEPAVGPDGRIALELYDKEGFTLGGVEVTGERNAIFSIVRHTDILCTGRFDTTSQASILKALSQFRQLLE